LRSDLFICCECEQEALRMLEKLRLSRPLPQLRATLNANRD
jgi:hypothetical protein